MKTVNPRALSDPALEGRRGLVVEDEMLVAMTIKDSLVDAGCTVIGPTGRLEQAISLAHAEALDFALLDINLNGKWIFPLADLLAGLRVPFAFLTGYVGFDLPPRFAGAPRLEKPFHAADILRLVNQLLESAKRTDF
jgi:DNA-binding response OmpR family regulator